MNLDHCGTGDAMRLGRAFILLLARIGWSNFQPYPEIETVSLYWVL
jgi:hypothetical protein